MGWAYIPPIDAAADANGARNFHRNRAVGPDFGREQSLFCGGPFLSTASEDALLFDIVEREEKRRRRCPCAGSIGPGNRHRPDLCFLVSTPLWGNLQMDGLCQIECSDSRIKFFQLESLILAQNERWRQA